MTTYVLTSSQQFDTSAGVLTRTTSYRFTADGRVSARMVAEHIMRENDLKTAELGEEVRGFVFNFESFKLEYDLVSGKFRFLLNNFIDGDIAACGRFLFSVGAVDHPSMGLTWFENTVNSYCPNCKFCDLCPVVARNE